jgi:pilus assembly protein Flp/PilA
MWGRYARQAWSRINVNAYVIYRLAEERGGVTSIEYALIAALIAVAAIAALTLIGTRLSTTFSSVANRL